MLLKKNIKVGKLNLNLFLYLFIMFFFLVFETRSNDSLEGQNINLKVLDKISSKNELIKLDNGEEYIYKDLSIKSLKCTILNLMIILRLKLIFK